MSEQRDAVPTANATQVDAPGPAGVVVVSRVEEVLWFLIGLSITLLALRFVLKLLGASPQAPFTQFLYAVTTPLLAPFAGIFPITQSGVYVFEPEVLIAIPVYILLGWAIVVVIRITLAPRRWLV